MFSGLLVSGAKPGFCICDGSSATLEDSWRFLITRQLVAHITVSATLLSIQKVPGTCFPGTFPELAGWAQSQVCVRSAATGLPVPTACKAITT